MKKVIFMCAVSSALLFSACKRLGDKGSKDTSKELSKDAKGGEESKNGVSNEKDQKMGPENYNPKESNPGRNEIPDRNELPD
jgi:hypothetical protein